MISPFLLLIFAVLLFLVFRFSFKRGRMTCDHYVGNTLLFLTLAITIILFFVQLNQTLAIPQIPSSFMAFLGFLLLFFILIYLFYQVDNMGLSLLIWLAMLYLFAYLSGPLYRFLQMKQDLLVRVLIQLVMIFLVFSLLGFYKPNLFHRGSMLIGLMITLVLLIVSHILLAFVLPVDMNQRTRIFQILSAIAIVVFSLFIWYDIGTLRLEQNICTVKTVNYMKHSFSLLLDVLNLFQSLVGVQMNS